MNESLGEALHRITSDVAELGDIDRALRDVRVSRVRTALFGVVAACLALLLFQGITGVPRPSLEPVGPTPAPGCPGPATLGIRDDRGPAYGNPVMDVGAGLVVVHEERQTWAFDVCRAEWRRRSPGGPTTAVQLVHHEGAGLTLAIPFDLRDPVWTYSAQRDEWVKLPPPTLVGDRGDVLGVREIDGRPSTAYDPVRGVVLAWAWKQAAVWSFELAENTWTRVDDVPDGAAAPRAGEAIGAIQYVTFDPTVDRLVLTHGADLSQTWVFDPESGAWEQGDSPPRVGTWHQGRGTTYDPNLGRSLIFSVGIVAGYDARTDQWQRLTSKEPSPGVLDGAWLVHDSVNDRLLALRYADVPDTSEESGDPHTWAYDPATGDWHAVETHEALTTRS